MRTQRKSLMNTMNYRNSKSMTKKRVGRSTAKKINKSDANIDLYENSLEDSKTIKKKDTITIGSLIWLHKKMSNLKQEKDKKNQMRKMLREKNKTNCPKLLERINKRLGSLSSYAINEEEAYEKNLKRLNKFYTRLHKKGKGPLTMQINEKITAMRSFIQFKKRFSYNLTRVKFVKRFVEASKEDSFLFIFYKADKDVDIHISLEENVKFKGLIFRNINLSEIDCVFYKRHYDFSCKNSHKHKRLYISLTFEQRCKLNICFKAEIKQASQTAEQKNEFRRRRDVLINQPLDPNFHNKMIKQIENINLYRGLKKKYKFLDRRTTILKRNRKAASTFRRDKKIKKSIDKVRARKRVRSARVNREVQERKRLAKCSKNVFRKDLKEIQVMIRNEYYYRVNLIENWVKYVKCCGILMEIYAKFRRRINQIQRFENLAAGAQSVQDVLKYPEMLRIPSEYRTEMMEEFLQKKASLYIGLTLNEMSRSDKMRVRFISMKLKCLKCLSRFQRHLEIKKTSCRRMVKLLQKEINESAFWQQYFDSGLPQKKVFKISENLDFFKDGFLENLADVFVNYDMLKHSLWLLEIRKAKALMTVSKIEKPNNFKYNLQNVEESLRMNNTKLVAIVSQALWMQQRMVDKSIDNKKAREYYKEYYPNYSKYLVRALIFSKCYNEINLYPKYPQREHNGTGGTKP